MTTWLRTHSKAIVGLVLAAVTYVVSTYPSNVNVQHWGGLVLAVLTAAGVYATPNTATKRHATKEPTA